MGKRKNKLESALADLEQQGLLLDIPEHPVEKEARETKQCTGALLLKRDIDTYSAIVRALAANKPIRWIKRTFGVGTQTVYAIQQREATKVGTLKERIADWCFMGALAGASRFAEVVADCDDPVAVALATAKMGEFGNLMRGQATQIVATVNVNVDAKAAGEDLMRKAQAMGLQAGENLPLAADSGRLAIPGDSKAPVTMAQTIENEGFSLSCDTGCDTGRDSDGQISDGGGGGATPTPVRPL
jgi:hypothetical protein